MIKNINKGAIKRPYKKWVEKFFISYDECRKTLDDVSDSIYDHDIKTIYGTHGEEYLLSVEIDSMNNLEGFLDDAFEGYYDD